MTEEEFEIAISEMKNVQELVEKTVHPYMAGEKVSNQDLEDARVLKLIRSEIDRLNAKKNTKGIERHQRIIDKEGKVPEAAPPEKMFPTEAAKIRDLAKEEDISFRAEQFAAGLIESHKTLMATDILPATASVDDIKKAIAEVEESKKYYDHLLNERTVDDKFPAKKFVLQQAEFGKDIALGQIRSLQDRLSKPKTAEVKAPQVVAVHETTPTTEEDPNIKKLTKLLPKGI